MTVLDDHSNLFRADWIASPSLLEERIRATRVSDRFTAELAAWCAELHEHLRELAETLGIKLILMGGNGAALRFDAARQRGSRDNDYLTSASPAEIETLMDHLGERFAGLDGLLQPKRYEPKGPVRELPMATYVVPVPLLLDHGNARNNEVKLEFHFEDRLPATETVTGALGPAATPEMTAALPQLPYQIGLKLMTLAANPVGIDETTRAASVPRQMYDIDMLTIGLTAEMWTALSDYCAERYAYECARTKIDVSSDEPLDGIRARIERRSDCLDETSPVWAAINAAQSGLQRAAHLRPWGWRARAHRLIVVIEALRLGGEGWGVWESALAAVALVPDRRAKAYRAPLAALAGVGQGELPVELHHYVWEVIALAPGADLAERIERVADRLEAVRTRPVALPSGTVAPGETSSTPTARAEYIVTITERVEPATGPEPTPEVRIAVWRGTAASRSEARRQADVQWTGAYGIGTQPDDVDVNIELTDPRREAATRWLQRLVGLYAGLDSGLSDPVHAARVHAQELIEAGPTVEDPYTIAAELAAALPYDSRAVLLGDTWRRMLERLSSNT